MNAVCLFLLASCAGTTPSRRERRWSTAQLVRLGRASLLCGEVNLLLSYAMTEHPHNPLQGMTLEAILTILVERHGWETLAQRINVRCFTSDPSIKSSLTFLRKTPWARQKVEAWYLYDLRRGFK